MRVYGESERERERERGGGGESNVNEYDYNVLRFLMAMRVRGRCVSFGGGPCLIRPEP